MVLDGFLGKYDEIKWRYLTSFSYVTDYRFYFSYDLFEIIRSNEFTFSSLFKYTKTLPPIYDKCFYWLIP